SYTELSGLSGSISSIWRKILYIVASAIWILENLFDSHQQEVTGIIATMRPHSLRWYAEMARKFQYGFNLLPDSEDFDNDGKTGDEIEASKIVAYAAVDKVEGKLLVKVAKDAWDSLTPLEEVVKQAFTEYMERVQDAGDDLEIRSEPADNLRLSLDIYYNPLVLNADGQRLDGASLTPIPDAVHNYLKNLPFNGELVLAFLTDALQAVSGVVIPHIVSAEYQYGEIEWKPVGVKYKPYAGYLTVTETDLEINYIPQSEIMK
ncbi:MAG: hypothetical protein ACK5KN_02595, partial [Dysgonomonas sp.]|uniref:hypothetical protein n=1 Tax=Dysgonomonas sp. TaxID=1891233 RepID=UPI003A87B7A2